MAVAAAGPIRRFVFLGAPGVGKGTFAGIIAPRLGLKVVTAGDLVRAEMNKAGAASEWAQELRRIVEAGGLVPDEIMVPLVAEGLPSGNASSSSSSSSSSHGDSGGGGGGYILDGFPRTAAQARTLDAMLAARGLGPIQRAVNIELADWVAIAKLLGRHQCPRCGHAFNTGHIVRDGYDMPALAPPSTAQDCPKGHRDDCPAARGELARRSDDNEATIQRRLEVYRKEIAPVLSFYEERGILCSFQVKKGVKDAPALEAMMTRTERE